jgi:hypothetical protein
MAKSPGDRAVEDEEGMACVARPPGGRRPDESAGSVDISGQKANVIRQVAKLDVDPI